MNSGILVTVLVARLRGVNVWESVISWRCPGISQLEEARPDVSVVQIIVRDAFILTLSIIPFTPTNSDKVTE